MRNTLVIVLLFIVSNAFGQHPIIDPLIWDGNYEKALDELNNVKENGNRKEEKVWVETKKAEILVRSGKFEQAEKILGDVRIYTLSQTPPPPIIDITDGFLNLNKGRSDIALERLQRAQSTLDQSGSQNSLEYAQCLSHLGDTYRTTGQYMQAEQNLLQALAIREKLLPAKHELIAASYNDLGLAYQLSDKDKALDYYERGLSLYQELHSGTHPKVAIAKTNLGYVYADLELYGDAISNFEEALKIWETVHTGAHPSKGFLNASLGRTYEKMNDFTKARTYLERALKLYNDSYQSKHPEIARVLNSLGNLEQHDGHFAEALQYFQRALHANHASFTASSPETNPRVGDFYDGHVLLYSLLNKAQTYESQYFKQSLRFKDLLNAIRTLQTCDTLIDRLRNHIQNESDKMALGAIANEVYQDGVRISSEAATVAWKKNKWREQAFYFAEKSKSAVLLSSLSEANAKSFAGIPPSLLENEKELKSSLAFLSEQLAQKPEDEKELRQKFFARTREYQMFSEKLEKEFPAYYNLKYNTASPSIPQLQETLPLHTAILSYFIDEKNHRLYIFQITKSDVRQTEVSLPDNYEKYITGLRNSIRFSDLPSFIKSSKYLSSLLCPKIGNDINDLVIIPTGRLSTVPFEALLSKMTGSDESYADLPYMIKEYSIRYEFSSGLILQKKGTVRIQTPSILLCAPVTFPVANALPDLPGTETEVMRISELFKARKLKYSLYLGENATEQSVKNSNLKDYSVLHFATHGIVDEVHPELSRIYLNSGSETEDGNLFAGEIYNLELNANLVTLSACQTGLGKISKGEGVIGLSRALVYAGAKNCLVTFWKVADESTAELMKDYYALILEGRENNLTSTLQQAKLSLMKHPAYAAPYYWAPFILIGF